MAGLSNKQIAGVFKEIEILLKLSGESEQRARNYGRLSRMIEGLEESAADLAAAGTLTDIRGVGPRVQAIVADLVDTGTSRMRDELAESIGPGVLEILRVPGLGPKRIHTIVTELGVSSIEDLSAAAVDGRLAALPGMGAKTAINVLESVAFLNRTRGRLHLSAATVLAHEVAEAMGIVDPIIAGQLRRCPILIDQITILCVGEVDRVLRDDPRGALPALRVRTVPAASLARALFEETGPASHVESVLALPGTGGSEASEEEIYVSRGLHWVPPERRHACDGTSAVPPLIAHGDVLGVVHAHTTWSDGTLDIAGMADAAHERGYSYLTITDHSQTAVYARGLPTEKLLEQNDAVREYSGPVRVLHGIETDILPNGDLDYPDDVLAKLDVVIASVHSSFTQDPDVVTERILKAVRHPRVHILGHMTGRVLLRRDGYAVDVERILEAAAESGTLIELNANPWRLDVDPEWHARCIELGVGVPICPDAHSADGIDDVHWGVLAARHGGLGAGDVPNTLDCDGFLEAIQK